MFKWFKKLKEDWNAPIPEIQIQVGVKVMYLGVEWTVTQSTYIDVFSTRKLERIAENGMHDSVRVSFHSPLVSMLKNA